MTHWRILTAKAAAANDLRCRLDNILKCKLFHHWRIRTAVNNTLALRLVDFEQFKSHRSLRHYFAEWKKAKNCRALLRRVITFACHRWKEYIQDLMYHSPENVFSRTLTAWQMAVHLIREECRFDRIHASIQCAHEENLGKQCLSIWRHHATSSRAIRVAREEFVEQKRLQFSEKLALKRKSAIVSSWLTHTLEKTAALAALAVECTVDQPRRNALTAWRLAAQDSIYRKIRSQAAKNMLSTSSVPTKRMPRSTLVTTPPVTTRQPLANVTNNTPPAFFSSIAPIPHFKPTRC